MFKSRALVLLFVSAACAPLDPTLEIEIDQSEAPLICRGCNDLYIVAHQDDDLLFMNPDIQNSIRAGNIVRTLYLTGGAGGNPFSFVLAREDGVRAAYADMAGVPNIWTPDLIVANGHVLNVSRLPGTNISLIFMRLPTSDDLPALRELWEGTAPSITSDDALNTFTRADLINTIRAIMTTGPARRVSTLDSTGTPGDHVDHTYAARFAFAAHEALTTAHSLSMYVAYATAGWTSNLHASEIQEKETSFAAYAVHDAYIGAGFSCQATPGSAYCAWLARQYPYSSERNGRGHIGVSDGRCLTINAAAPYAGAVLSLGACNAAGALRFNLANGRIQQSGYCATASGSSAVLNLCTAGAANQRFIMTNNGQIRGPNATCLEATSLSTNVISLVTCPPSQVLNWTRQPIAANYLGVVGQFGTSDVGNVASYARTFRLGDVNGDGRADACIRKTDGVYCALAGANGFASYTLFVAAYADSSGWGADWYGTTIQLGDINGDGLADLCGRGSAGVWCSTSNGSAFVNTALRTTSFSDADGWAAHASYYRTIKLADVNGDGRADLCGRASQGIWCTLADINGNFPYYTPWLLGAFDDNGGWYSDTTGATVQFGDINADGLADVCGRAGIGVYCAVGTGSSFVNPHPWTFPNDYSDATGWNTEALAQSLRLADIDGDGAADLCGRQSNGIACATSNGGNSFSPLRMYMPRVYVDAGGWGPSYYSATLTFGDLDNDGRADACLRGGDRLYCSIL